MQRGGSLNTDSGFFSRELDPTFTFNTGAGGTRDEYIGAMSLFVPLNRRFHIGISMPFVDSLQRISVLPTENSFGDVVVAPQLMLDETETRFDYRGFAHFLKPCGRALRSELAR